MARGNITRGRVYTIQAQRTDGAFTVFRTTDRREALRIARTLGVSL